MTAHADQRQIEALIRRVKPKVTIFGHGRPSRIKRFLDQRPDLPGEGLIPRNGVTYTFD